MSTQPTVIDLWEQVEPLFTGAADDDSELHLLDLTPVEMTTCVLYIMRQSTSCTPAFFKADTQQRVLLPSAKRAIELMLNRDVVGGFWVNMVGMKALGIFVDEPDILTINYRRGRWSPMTVMFLFDLLYRLTNFAPSAYVLLSPTYYTDDDQIHFESVWNAYYHAR